MVYQDTLVNRKNAPTIHLCETMEKGKESDKTQSGIHLQEDSTESEDESNEE